MANSNKCICLSRMITRSRNFHKYTNSQLNLNEYKNDTTRRDVQRKKAQTKVSEFANTQCVQVKNPMSTITNELEKRISFQNLKNVDVSQTKLWRLLIHEKQQQGRRKSDIIVLEGLRLVKDALVAGAQAKYLCFSNPDILHQLEKAKDQLCGVQLFCVSAEYMKTFSDTVTPAGILGIFKKPKQGEAVHAPKHSIPLTVILDNLKDPGNAGTLIRTAAAAGCQRLLATDGCVNLWERKVLRSAMGAHFHLPITMGVSWPDVGNLLTRDTQLFLASCSGSEDPLTNLKSISDSTGCNHKTNHESTSSEMESSSQTNIRDIKCYNYFDMLESEQEHDGLISNTTGYTKAALVIGSEAFGLSSQAVQLATNRGGACVSIPMNENINSLNSAVAGSIIIYELRKRLQKVHSDYGSTKV